jgi:hypothetical protein
MEDAITAEIPYTIATDEKLVNESFGPKNIYGRRTGTVELKPMIVQNGRRFADALSLEKEGFIFVEHKTKVADFFDENQVTSIYYPEIEDLIRRASGASRVVIFDHALRSGDEVERGEKLIRTPVLQAHNDYTEWSGPNRLREILPDEADELLKRRFAIIQVWRPIHRPVESNPLAVADARSVELDDWMVAERRYPHRVGQTYRLKYNRAHRWFYFPGMRPDEAIVFKVYDSEKDGRARFTAHTSFNDPATAPGARARQSIEMRAFAFFDR